jgi:hypothetical protein
VNVKSIAVTIIALLLSGCAHLDEQPNFISFAEGIEGRVTAMVNSDPVLAALIERYDPHYGAFHDGEEACYYPVGPKIAGFYRAGKMCRNPDITITDTELFAILRHEFLHLVWDRLSTAQQAGWLQHLATHPSPLEPFIVRQYSSNIASELFAYTLESEIRPGDGAALVKLRILPARFTGGDRTFANRFFGPAFSRH